VPTSTSDSNLYNAKMKENFYTQFGKSERQMTAKPMEATPSSAPTLTPTAVLDESKEARTYQEEIFEAAKTIVLSTKRMIAARKYSVRHSEQDASTEAAKEIVGATKIILTITHKFALETGYEKPQAIAHEINGNALFSHFSYFSLRGCCGFDY
jgi:hypothetical protein